MPRLSDLLRRPRSTSASSRKNPRPRSKKRRSPRPQRRSGNGSLDVDEPNKRERRPFAEAFQEEYQCFCHNALAHVWTLLPMVINEKLVTGIGEGDVRIDEPHLLSRDGCVISLTIVGVSSLIGQVSYHDRGVGYLSKCMDSLLSPLIDIITSYHGDILRLEGGGSLTVFFEAAKEVNTCSNPCGSLDCRHGPVELACLRATACCIELQKRFDDLSIGGEHMSLRIGVGTGTITVVIAKGAPGSYTTNALEYFCLGRPLEEAQAASALANPGQTVFCPESWSLVQTTVFEGPVISASPSFHILHAFDTTQHTYPMVRHATQQCCKPILPPEHVDTMLEKAFEFLPPAIIRNTAAGVLGSADNLRRVPMAVACIRIANGISEKDAVSAARLVFSLQCLVHVEEAFVTDLFTKGDDLFFQICFGLPPLVHADDSLRACRGCLSICQAVLKAQGNGFACHAGVATGRVFVGLVGRQRSRHRYIVMGNVVQESARLCAQASAHTTLIDESTANACKGLVELEPQDANALDVPIAVEGCAEPEARTPTYEVRLRLMHDRLVMRQKFHGTRSPPPTPPPMAKPPWLPPPQGCREQGLLCWAHLCAERPPPPVDLRTLALCTHDRQDLASPTNQHWKTHLKIPLPWPARSVVCGGVSPLPRLTTWSSMTDGEAVVDAVCASGGGLVIVNGPAACGKVELTEHLLCRAIKARMQPVIGAMEMRPGEKCAAFGAVLRSLLSLLEPSGHIAEDSHFHALLQQEACSRHETQSLQDLGILPVDVQVEVCAERSINVNCFSTDNAANEEHGPILGVIDLVIRLAKRVLQNGDLVVCLRVSQGTTLLESDCTAFWMLIDAFARLAENTDGCRARQMLVLVCCQSTHAEAVSSKTRWVNVAPLSERELVRYIHLCMGLPDPGSEPSFISEEGEGQNYGESPATCRVPAEVVKWIRQVASLPRHIEECLTQLHSNGAIAVEDGRCILLHKLREMPVSDWTRTHVVGRIVSQLEFMDPDMQYIMVVAAIMWGPFSPLDISVTNRMQHEPERIPILVACYNAVKRLKACVTLAELGFLTREEREEKSCLPRWAMKSQLVREVVLANIEGHRRRLLKRAILMARAMEKIKVQRLSSKTHIARLTDLQYAFMSTKEEGIFCGQQEWFTQPSDAMEGPRQITRYAESVLPASCVVLGEEDGGLSSSSESDTESESSAVSSVSESVAPKRTFSLAKRVNSRELEGFLDRMRYRVENSEKLQVIVRTIAFVGLSFLLFVPDLWVVVDGHLGFLYVLLVTSSSSIGFGIVINILFQPRYICSLMNMTDIALFGIICNEAVRVGEALVSSEVPFSSIQRKQHGSIARLLADWIKFGACVVRLFWLAQSDVMKSYFSCKKRQASEKKEFMYLQTINTKLARAILIVFTTFMVTSITMLNVTESYTPPLQDQSMKIWVEVLAMKFENTSGAVNSSLASLESDAERFASFYDSDNFDYGPFQLCKWTGFPGCHPLWPGADLEALFQDFSEPGRAGAQLDVTSKSGRIMASFDFSQAARLEAGMRMVQVAMAMLGMLVAAVTLDIGLARLIVEPLSRILSAVHEVSLNMQRAFPQLDFCKTEDDFGDDEVTAFGKNVEKVTRLFNFEDKENQEKDKMAVDFLGVRPKEKKASEDAKDVNRHGSTSSHGFLLSRLATLESHGLSYADIASWNFDVNSMEEEKLTAVASWLVSNSGFEACASLEVVDNFIKALRGKYLSNPYHNWRHAVDVIHSVSRQVTLANAVQYWTALDIYALLVASVGHDAGHPGLNNIFLVQTSHTLALRYNDISPLENMHCAKLFSIQRTIPKADVFNGLSVGQYKEARKVCIQAILHTDNEKHFEMIKHMKMFCATAYENIEQQVGDFPSEKEVEALKSNKSTFLCAFLHGADVSNTCKPWIICKSWAELVLNELFLQGDLEKKLHIPIQMLNNRDTLNRPKSQMTFIQLFIVPFKKELVGIFPPLWEYTMNLELNLNHWHGVALASEAGVSAAETLQVEKASKELEEVVERSRQRVMCINDGTASVCSDVPDVFRSDRCSHHSVPEFQDAAWLRQDSGPRSPASPALSAISGAGAPRTWLRASSMTIEAPPSAPSADGDGDGGEAHPLGLPPPDARG